MNKLHLFATTIIAVFCLSYILEINAAENGHYRWIDDKGQVQYSDRPPEGIDAEFIKFSSRNRTRSTGSNQGKSDDAAEAIEKKLASTLEVMPEKDPALCKQAQKNLKALEGARIRITEADGSKRFLTEDEKEGQRENARKFIKINC